VTAIKACTARKPPKTRNHATGLFANGMRSAGNGTSGTQPGSEMVVMYANGHVSDVQHMVNESPKKRNAALTALGRP
jgi:hypothetical protein